MYFALLIAQLPHLKQRAYYATLLSLVFRGINKFGVLYAAWARIAPRIS